MRYGLTTDRDWPFLIDGKEQRVVVRGQRIANDGELVRVWCRNGLGIARKSRLDVEADLREGALVELLRDFSSGDTGLQIVYPATQAQPRRVRLLIEKIAQAFSSSGPKFWSWPGISRDVGSATPSVNGPTSPQPRYKKGSDVAARTR
jgi:DNA-binding transcriptional LysR family regulator